MGGRQGSPFHRRVIVLLVCAVVYPALSGTGVNRSRFHCEPCQGYEYCDSLDVAQSFDDIQCEKFGMVLAHEIRPDKARLDTVLKHCNHQLPGIGSTTGYSINDPMKCHRSIIDVMANNYFVNRITCFGGHYPYICERPRPRPNPFGSGWMNVSDRFFRLTDEVQDLCEAEAACRELDPAAELSNTEDADMGDLVLELRLASRMPISLWVNHTGSSCKNDMSETLVFHGGGSLFDYQDQNSTTHLFGLCEKMLTTKTTAHVETTSTTTAKTSTVAPFAQLWKTATVASTTALNTPHVTIASTTHSQKYSTTAITIAQQPSTIGTTATPKTSTATTTATTKTSTVAATTTPQILTLAATTTPKISTASTTPTTQITTAATTTPQISTVDTTHITQTSTVATTNITQTSTVATTNTTHASTVATTNTTQTSTVLTTNTTQTSTAATTNTTQTSTPATTTTPQTITLAQASTQKPLYVANTAKPQTSTASPITPSQKATTTKSKATDRATQYPVSSASPQQNSGWIQDPETKREYIINRNESTFPEGSEACRSKMNASMVFFTNALQYLDMSETLRLASGNFWVGVAVNNSHHECLQLRVVHGSDATLSKADCRHMAASICSRTSNVSDVLENPAFVRLLADMKVDSSETQKSKRKLVSIYDERKSATAVGSIGVIAVVSVFTLIAMLDLTRLKCQCGYDDRNKMSKVKAIRARKASERGASMSDSTC